MLASLAKPWKRKRDTVYFRPRYMYRPGYSAIGAPNCSVRSKLFDRTKNTGRAFTGSQSQARIVDKASRPADFQAGDEDETRQWHLTAVGPC